MGVAGHWLDRLSFAIYQRLEKDKPPAVVIGSGAWNEITPIMKAAGPQTKGFLRDMENDDDPELMAQRICDAADANPEVRHQLVGYGLNEHGVNTWTKRMAYQDKELRFIRTCHARNLPVITWNVSWGVPDGPADVVVPDMAEDLKILYDEAEYIGPHYYDVFYHAFGIWIDRRYSCYRYQFFPSWVNRGKIWSTEVGFDSEDRPEGLPDSLSPGWRTIPVSEATIRNRMLENIAQWRKDGLGGFVNFALRTLNSEWDPYNPSEEMLNEWSAMEPFSGISVPDSVPDEPGGDDMPWTFQAGFRNYAIAHPDEVGQPLMDERYLGSDFVYQVTTTGRLETGKDQNGNWLPVYFYPKAGT